MTDIPVLTDQGLVIVVGMLKGGTGKTTTAIFTALAFAEQGREVEVLDGDLTSQSAYDWWLLASGTDRPLPFRVTRFPFENIAEEIQQRRTAGSVLIIDAGGHNAGYLEEACSEADALLIPLSPTAADARRLDGTWKTAERAAARNPHPAGLYAVCTLVRADRRTTQPRKWRAQLDADDRSLTETIIGDRVLYSDAYGQRPEHPGEYTDLINELDGDMELTPA